MRLIDKFLDWRLKKHIYYDYRHDVLFVSRFLPYYLYKTLNRLLINTEKLKKEKEDDN